MWRTSGFSGQNCDVQVTCPTENINYKVVDDRCYYFQNTFSHYIPTHRGFCKTLFSGNGRLFEPKNLATLKKVHKVAKDNFNRDVWFIGVRDPYKNGTLTFESNGSTIHYTIPFQSFPFGGKDYANESNGLTNCVLIYPDGKWRRFCCYCSAQFAICENAS